MSTRNRAGTNRWSINDENPGSIFHEVVVLPTLAPHLAHPEYLDSTPGSPTILPQPQSQQIENGITVVQLGMFDLNFCQFYDTENSLEAAVSTASLAVRSGSFSDTLSSIEDESRLSLAPAVGVYYFVCSDPFILMQ